YNGTKMVVFGGETFPLIRTLSSIYILDLQTLVWTKGTDVHPSQNRSDMACAVSGDYFIAWGGGYYDETTSVRMLEMTIIYNLKTSQWVDEFIAPPRSEPSKGSNAAAIGGGVAALAFFTFKRRKSK
ncbi:hypothetical protein BG015_006619, partial [Linnemannia schmuckeri]